MKKVVAFCILLQAVVLAFAGSEELEMYTYLYNDSDTHVQQLDLLESIAQMNMSGAGDFYSQALRRLVSEYPNIQNATEQDAANDQAILLAQLLGEENYTASAPDLWLAYNAFSAPLVKAEVLMSLGKVQGGADLGEKTSYLAQVISVLNSLNMAPVSDRMNGERIAFGAIIALEKYKDSKGYLPVYFAAKGWYSERVKNQAIKSLDIISDDPSSFMIDIIKSSGYTYAIKYEALQNAEASRISNDKKAAVAAAALAEGWRASTRDVALQNTLARMRTMSMKMINAYGASDDTVYDLLVRCYDNGIDIDEKKLAVTTLSTLATEEAVKRLSKFLMDFNAKRTAGTFNNNRDNEILVREVIPALGATKKPSARPPLIAVTGLDWTPAIINLAREALRQIP